MLHQHALVYPPPLVRRLRADFANVVHRIKLLGFNAVRLPFDFARLQMDLPAPSGGSKTEFFNCIVSLLFVAWLLVQRIARHDVESSSCSDRLLAAWPGPPLRPVPQQADPCTEVKTPDIPNHPDPERHAGGPPGLHCPENP